MGDLNGRPMISQKPDLRSYTLSHDNDLMLFLSSDGIWDTLSEVEIYNCVIDFVVSRTHTGNFFIFLFLFYKRIKF